MKKQDKAALTSKTSKELTAMVSDLDAQLLKTKMEKFAGKLTNTSLVKTLSDDLARVKTALRMLELAEMKQAKMSAAEKKIEKPTEKKVEKKAAGKTEKKAAAKTTQQKTTKKPTKKAKKA